MPTVGSAEPVVHIMEMSSYFTPLDRLMLLDVTLSDARKGDVRPSALEIVARTKWIVPATREGDVWGDVGLRPR